MNANRSYSRLTRGTWRSRNTSAKYCGCSLLNSYKRHATARTSSSGSSLGVPVSWRCADLAEAFLGEREEDLVLRREVAVDRAGAVFDLGGDVADGDLGVAVGDEELERGVEDGATRGLTRVLLAFFCCLTVPVGFRGLNSVQ